MLRFQNEPDDKTRAELVARALNDDLWCRFTDAFASPQEYGLQPPKKATLLDREREDMAKTLAQDKAAVAHAEKTLLPGQKKSIRRSRRVGDE